MFTHTQIYKIYYYYGNQNNTLKLNKFQRRTSIQKTY